MKYFIYGYWKKNSCSRKGVEHLPWEPRYRSSTGVLWIEDKEHIPILLLEIYLCTSSSEYLRTYKWLVTEHLNSYQIFYRRFLPCLQQYMHCGFSFMYFANYIIPVLILFAQQDKNFSPFHIFYSFCFKLFFFFFLFCFYFYFHCCCL